MIIDAFDETCYAELGLIERHPLRRTYLLIDGAFLPGLQKVVDKDRKAILFESLPACTEEAKDVSPFLMQIDPADKTQTSLFRHCNRWPMVSLIETQESLHELAERLAAWCVIEADGQRFNLRFPDTRRLPAIFQTLNTAQRAQIAGPAVRWSYVARDGQWRELEIDGSRAEIAASPILDQRQFAMLVDDSRIDELLTLLGDRGHEIYRHPSRSHALLTVALCAAVAAELDNDDLVGWCEWFWQEDHLHDQSAAGAMLDAFRKASI